MLSREILDVFIFLILFPYFWDASEHSFQNKISNNAMSVVLWKERKSLLESSDLQEETWSLDITLSPSSILCLERTR